MTVSLRKHLISFLLVVAVLLAPLKSFSHHLEYGAAKDTCACQSTLTDCGSDERGDRPIHDHGNDASDCCDGEGCCQEAAEPPFSCGLSGNVFQMQGFQLAIARKIPDVYLAIFVPPENCSFA
jgi:hypothetical protein